MSHAPAPISTSVRFWPALAAWLLSVWLAGDASARAAWVHQAWTVREGMPVNSVTAVLQSRSGHLWLGTFDGLVRFDGVRFHTFTLGNTPGLAHNRIHGLAETAEGLLVLGTDVGVLQRLDPAIGQAEVLWNSPGGGPSLIWTAPDGVVHASLHPGLGRIVEGRIEAIDVEPMPTLDVTALAFGPGPTLYLATEGQGVWTLAAGQMRQLAVPGEIGVGHVHALLDDGPDRLWVAGEGGVQWIEPSGVRWLTDEARTWRTSTQVLARDAGRRILIGSERGLHAWVGGRVLPVDPADPRRSPRTPVVQAGEEHWLLSASAVLREVHGSGGTWHEPIHRLADTEATRIVHALGDQGGSLWLATIGGGLHRLRPAAFTMLGEAEGLSAREVYPLHEDAAGAIWIGTQKGGLNRYLGGEVEVYGAAAGLGDDNIRAIASDAAGTLWVATHEAGLFHRPRDGDFVAEPAPLLAGTRIRALFLDRAGVLWAGAEGGLYRRDAGQGWQRHAASTALEGCAVRVIRQGEDAALWLGTDRCGAFRLTPEGGLEPLFTVAGKGMQEEGSRYIRDIHLLDRDNLWLASEDRGLIRVYRSGEGLHVVSVGARQGLPSDGAHQILDDGHGWFWVSTNQGIYRTPRSALEAVAAALRQGLPAPALAVDRYGEADGLRNREANGGVQSTAIVSSRGELWFATQDGVAIVDPRPERLERHPRPRIEAVVSGDQQWPAAAPLLLPAARRSFRVDFTELRQMDPARTRLRYRLVGHDEDWIEAGGLRRAYYTRVPPGGYEFRVEGWTGSRWSADAASLRLTVLPYLHETASFRALLVCIVALLLWLLYRARVGWLQAQRRELQRQVAQRTEELKRGKEAAEEASRLIAVQAEQLREADRQKSRFYDDLAHELRTPLTLILGPLREVERAREHAPAAIEGAIRNGEVLLELTNQLLDLARLESGKLELDRQRRDLVALLRTSAIRFRPLALSRGIGFGLRLPVDPVWALLDPRHAGKIVDNLLSNAFKFTEPGGQVELSLHIVGEGEARIEVGDTGIGIPPEHLARVFDRFYQSGEAGSRLQPGTGIGLALVNDLTRLHDGRLEVRSHPGAGTTFAVILPLAGTSEAASAFAEETLSVAAAASAPEGVDVETADAERTTVLVADDHAELRAHVRRHLVSRYRVIEAADGLAALGLARTHVPDLIVADVSMPGLDGLGLCAEIRRDPDLEGTPVILLTARASHDDRLEGLRVAADDYLTKPFDAAELLLRVDNLIELRRRLQRRFREQAAARPIVLQAEPDPGRTPVAVHPGPAAGAPERKPWRERLLSTVDASMADENFKVGELAEAMGLDRTQLFRRVREETGMAPSDLLRERRLARAAEMLQGDSAPIAEIAYAVGFASVAYFTQCFRERHGVTPGKFRLAHARAAEVRSD